MRAGVYLNTVYGSLALVINGFLGDLVTYDGETYMWVVYSISDLKFIGEL